MRDKSLILIAATGIALVTLVGLTASLDVGMLVGTLISWAPYAAVAAIQKYFISSSKLIDSLKGGLLVYLAIDLCVRYQALHRPASSTDAIAVLVILIGSVIIIPFGVVITYLLLSVVRHGKQS